MSALPPKADIVQHGRDVRFVPIADTVPSKSCPKYEGLLRGSLTERFVLRQERGRTQALLDSRNSAIWLVCSMSTVRLF
jgi:hypothetical protein